jgi:hypothetical protein
VLAPMVKRSAGDAEVETLSIIGMDDIEALAKAL